MDKVELNDVVINYQTDWDKEFSFNSPDIKLLDVIFEQRNMTRYSKIDQQYYTETTANQYGYGRNSDPIDYNIILDIEYTNGNRDANVYVPIRDYIAIEYDGFTVENVYEYITEIEQRYGSHDSNIFKALLQKNTVIDTAVKAWVRLY